MIPSVGPEANRELTEGAVYYAQEANAELLRVIALAHHRRRPGYWAGRT